MFDWKDIILAFVSGVSLTLVALEIWLLDVAARRKKQNMEFERN